ncbi:hypothetical protein [Helicobacter didelphidarum]|uniref:hypothetical protein n=1 Tax=Helicobacter didelphidarum TaxID=2040648 RepID=UPI0015F13DBC|nr:hypothetical protein [Helicobacter didelphidarum]
MMSKISEKYKHYHLNNIDNFSSRFIIHYGNEDQITLPSEVSGYTSGEFDSAEQKTGK